MNALELMEYSQTYFEKNVTASYNNFSILSLSALELALAAAKVKQDCFKIDAIHRNLIV